VEVGIILYLVTWVNNHTLLYGVERMWMNVSKRVPQGTRCAEVIRAIIKIYYTTEQLEVKFIEM
jgi:hypothetical protein